jgi:hypothetical protein
LLVVVVGINLEFTMAENTALQFDGINDVVIIPSSPSLLLANTFSFEAWVYPTNIEEDIIFSKNDRFNEDYVFFIDDPTRKLGVGISVWPAGFVYSNSSIPLHNWTHVAATYNGSEVRFFVNGQPDGVRSLNRIPRISDRPLQIGRSPWGRDEKFTGVIDEIRIWNYMRTETEITDKMCRSLTGQEPGLVGYWQLNEGADQIVRDSSVNGNDGHLGSFPQQDDNDPTWILSTVPNCGAVTLSLDIKPGSCPNPLNTNTRGKGRLPVAILGTDSFDVSTINTDSISINSNVFPVRAPKIEDIGTPLNAEECECHVADGDGFDDLVIHFSRKEIILALSLDEMEPGTVVPITVEGALTDGTPFEATDCVTLKGRGD